MRLASYGSGALAVFQRDAAMYLSYRMRLVTQVASLVVTITLFYYISRLISIDKFTSPDDYFEFVVIGLVIMQTVTSTMALLPSAFRQELVAGTFERMLLSPFGPVAGIVSMLIFPFAQSMLVAVLMVGFAAITFGLHIEWPTILLALPAGFLSALAFSPFALFFTAAVAAFKQAPGTGLVLAAISLVAGIYFPAELLPAWIRWASDVQPFTPAVDLMRHLMVGANLEHSAWVETAKLVGFALVLLPMSMLVLSAAVRVSQRRGTIIEY